LRVRRREELDAARETLRDIERRREAVVAEVQLLESLVSSYDEFSDAVRYLAGKKTWTSAPLRTVADVISCDEEDRIALDAALGDFASCIVVGSDTEAAEAILLLRSQGQGRATFIVLDRLGRVPPPLDTPPGVRSLLASVRVAEDRYEPLARLLLHHAFVGPSLEDARRIAETAPAGARLFAPSGEWVDARGFFHAGSRQQKPSAISARMDRHAQLASARSTLTGLDERIEASLAAFKAAQHALDAVQYDAARIAADEADKRRGTTDRALSQAQVELDAASRRSGEQAERLGQLETDAAATAAEREKLEANLVALNETVEAAREARTSAEAETQRLETDSRTAQDAFSEASVAEVQVRGRVEALDRDLGRIRQNLDEMDRRMTGQAEHVARLTTQIEAETEQRQLRAREMAALSAGTESLEDAVRKARADLEGNREALAVADQGLRHRRIDREAVLREENQRAVRLASVEAHLEDLVNNVYEHYQLWAHDIRVVLPEDFAEETVRREVASLRERAKSFGAVNALALQDYEEQKERLAFLEVQQADLEKAEATLLETISEINITASRRFAETYEAIRDNFQRIFVELFGDDAAADLQIADGDPLEAAIEIIARPRGKRPCTISQLSGGEKTLTAIALLFAIYLVKPSPFCILDEVDAPLDDANVERFMRLIRTFSRETQFILVTHNKRTMEAADRLYGITMQEQGVSQLVSVRFGDVTNEAA
jgi:chromosome segregation protein